MTRLVRQCEHAILFHQHHWEALPLWQLQASYENPHVFFLRNYPFWVASFWTFVKVKTSQSSKRWHMSRDIKTTHVPCFSMSFFLWLFSPPISEKNRSEALIGPGRRLRCCCDSNGNIPLDQWISMRYIMWMMGIFDWDIIGIWAMEIWCNFYGN